MLPGRKAPRIYAALASGGLYHCRSKFRIIGIFRIVRVIGVRVQGALRLVTIGVVIDVTVYFMLLW